MIGRSSPWASSPFVQKNVDSLLVAISAKNQIKRW